MMAAQRQTPLLWLVDGCGAIFLLGSWLFGAALEAQPGKGGLASQQVALLMDRIADLESLTREQDARIEAMENAGADWHDGFDTEAARLTEQAFLALSDGIEANAQQLENITMALRYQRSEMKALRSSLKQGVLLPEPTDTPPSLESVPRPPRAVSPRAAESEPASEPIQTEAAEPNATEEIPEEETAAEAMPVTELADTPEVTSAAASTSSVELDVDKIQRDRENAEVRAAAVAEEFNTGKTTGRTVFRRQRNK